MKIHELKLIYPYFDEVFCRNKTFEIRKNDRDFKLGDVLHLRHYKPESNEYGGSSILCEITYILDDPIYVKEGYVILGIRNIKEFY